MGSPGKGRPPPPPNQPLEEVVPKRAVLTELCRGFLLVQGSDPAHAARFARSFLQEHAGAAGPDRPVPGEHLPTVRRGLAAQRPENLPNLLE